MTHFSVFGDQFPIRVEDCTGIVQFVPITFWYTACIVMAGIYSTLGYPIDAFGVTSHVVNNA